jgi:glycosyltransferase involved in cell wall biosynthesis
MARPPAADSPQVSVIVLVYNEVDSIEPLHRELMSVLEGMRRSFEVLYIDDGSSDGSTERLTALANRDGRVRVVSFRRNFGQTAAVQAGIDHGRGEVIVFIDGDMQNDPRDIPHLLDKVDEGYDVVSGWRRDRRDDAWRVISSRAVNWVIARVSGLRLSDFGGTLKAYRRELIADVRLHGEMRRLLPVYAAEKGARITELPVNHRPRDYGTSKSSVLRSSRIAVDLIMAGLRPDPVYLLSFGAIGAWTVGLILAVMALVQKMSPAHVSLHNNPLLIVCVGLGIVGVQMFVGALLSVRVEEPAVYVVRRVIGTTHEKAEATNGRSSVNARP